MKQIKIILIVLAFVLLVISCTACNKSNTGSSPLELNVHSGTDGIALTLANGLPPAIIFKGDSFEIGVELHNKGTYNIKQGYVAVVGIDPKYFNIDKEEEFFEIKGRSMEYPEEGYALVVFKVKNSWFPEDKQELTIPFTLTARYDYETDATVDLCINPLIGGNVKSKVCETKEVTIAGGQGAPVAITKVQPVLASSNNEFGQPGIGAKFYVSIENKGNGNLISDITIKKAMIGNQEVKCDKINKEDLKDNNKWIVSCSVNLQSSQEAYTSPFTIMLNYNYRNTFDSKFTVKS